MFFENAEVSVIRSNRKTISIQIKPNEVIVRAPTRMKQNEFEKFAKKRNRFEMHIQTVLKTQKLFQRD